MARPELVGRIAERLVQGLAAGRWPEDAPLPSIRRLAREFGVSYHTIMGATHRLTEWGLLEVRQRHPARVPGGAREQAQRVLSQRLQDGRPRRLAVLITDFWSPPRHNAFYDSLIAGIRREASRQGTSTETVFVPVRKQLEMASRLLRESYDGAVFLAFEDEYMASVVAFHESGFPVLVFNRRIPELNLPTVTIDTYAASRAMVRRFAELGHRNMCLVASRSSHAELGVQFLKGHGKTVGWVDALLDEGLYEQCTMPVYIVWDYSRIGLYSGAFRRLMQGDDRPTAILFCHSPPARRFLEDPEFARLAVPGDISLATFEPATTIPHVAGRPAITSINVDPHRTAQCILETLGKMIANVPHPPTIRVPLTIEMTDSVGPLPSRSATGVR